MAPTHDANTHFVSRSSVTVVNSVSGHVTAMLLIVFLLVAFLDSFLPWPGGHGQLMGIGRRLRGWGRGEGVRLLLAA